MLVLRRFSGQSLDLILEEPLPTGTKLRVAVTGLDGRTVKVGIGAPRSVRVRRSELADEDREVDDNV